MSAQDLPTVDPGGRRNGCNQSMHATPDLGVVSKLMVDPDLNLLVALDVLLSEGGVAGAARRLGLSPSAMSRTLGRLREVTGDPLLVRAGRVMVPTPRALAMREEVRQLVDGSRGVLRPATAPDFARLERTFAIRANEGF